MANSPRQYYGDINHNDARIPIPQNFVVTGCYTNKMKFAWSPVIGHHNLYKSFEYEILVEHAQGHPIRRKITPECDALIENLVPGQEYTFYVRAVETSATLISDLSEPLDIKIPKDNKKINILNCTPRAAKWKYLKNENKIHISWKSPHHFYGDVSYELLFNDKVLGQCYCPPLILSKREIEKFDFTKGIFKIRCILISKEKNESNAIPIPYPDDMRQIIEEQKKHENDNKEQEEEEEEEEEEEIKEEEKEKEKDDKELIIRNNFDDRSIIYIWVCAPDPMPDLTLIPFGDPDFNPYSFKKLDGDEGIYLCAWPSYFINELDHYFLFGKADPKINLAAMPTFDLHYKGYWKSESKQQIKFFVVYTHKVLHRFAHAINGGVQGMHHKYKAILQCVINNIDNGITFKSGMKTIITMHQQWSQQQQLMYNDLQDIFFNKLEYYADSIDYYHINITQISVILLSIYWLLQIQHHKVHYRHLHHALNGLLNITNNDNQSVIDLIAEIMGKYVINLLKLFQSFAIEKLKKDRSRYFDLVWYQIIYLSTIKVIAQIEEDDDDNIDIHDIDNIHNEFMSEIDQILFNPNCLARPIGSEDLQSITALYIGLLKPKTNDNYYNECGIKLEELLIENHIKCEDILDTITFINKYKLSWSIFAKILYRNQNCYTFAEYSDGKQYLPELNIASDQKTIDLLSKYGFYTFVAQQKVPKQARCSVIHLIFTKIKNNQFDEKRLIFWFNVIKKLVLKYKDFQVSDQILYELQEYDDRKRNIKLLKNDKKYLKSLNSLIHHSFQESLPIYLNYNNDIIPRSLINGSLINSKRLYGILSVLLHFRHQKIENIDNENKDDFTFYLFGILMLELNELFFAEKYLMKSIIKRPNNPYGHYYADLGLLKIIQCDFISSFNYISNALNKKHTESYNKLILLYLYHHLIEYNHYTQNINPYNITSKRFNLNNIMSCDYYQNNKKKPLMDDLINKILENYYNSLRYLKSEKWDQAKKLIDEIYKFIGNVNIKQIKKQCRDIIESMKNVNKKIKNENQALIKSIQNNKKNKHKQHKHDDNDNDNDDDYKYDHDDHHNHHQREQKEQSPPKMYIVPPNDNDYD